MNDTANTHTHTHSLQTVANISYTHALSNPLTVIRLADPPPPAPRPGYAEAEPTHADMLRICFIFRIKLVIFSTPAPHKHTTLAAFVGFAR